MRVWFITGASKGFGALIAKEALDSGDTVVATARDPSAITKRLGTHERLLAVRLRALRLLRRRALRLRLRVLLLRRLLPRLRLAATRRSNPSEELARDLRSRAG